MIDLERPVSFQWKTTNGWVESNSGDAEERQRYARSMAESVGLGYREWNWLGHLRGAAKEKRWLSAHI